MAGRDVNQENKRRCKPNGTAGTGYFHTGRGTRIRSLCKMRFEIKPTKVQKVYRNIPLSHGRLPGCSRQRPTEGIPYHRICPTSRMETESDIRWMRKMDSVLALMQIHTINLPYLGEQIALTDLSDPVQNLSTAGASTAGIVTFKKYNLDRQPDGIKLQPRRRWGK